MAKKLSSLLEVSTFPSDGRLIISSAGSGTKRITKANAALELKEAFITGSGYHNSIFRGKNLGTINSLVELETFLTNHGVSSGAFNDIYLGDYITIKDGTYNAVWMIAGFNTELNKGSSGVISSNHITLIPRTKVTDAEMNASNDTTGGYLGSKMHTTTLPLIEAALQTVCGTHLKKHNILASNAMTAATPSMAGAGMTGASTGWEWASVYASLLTEVQVYGSKVWSSSAYDVGEGFEKLPVFNFINPIEYQRARWWLRAVVSGSHFALVDDGGNAGYLGASRSIGVRPLIVLA